MIDPTKADIGRRVVYAPLHEVGTITSFNASYVFVRYGHDQNSKATRRQDLIWFS
jgi:hypothetical protein